MESDKERLWNEASYSHELNSASTEIRTMYFLIRSQER